MILLKRLQTEAYCTGFDIESYTTLHTAKAVLCVNFPAKPRNMKLQLPAQP
jgi:hypothetical protein